jgi:hypothetical protein
MWGLARLGHETSHTSVLPASPCRICFAPSFSFSLRLYNTFSRKAGCMACRLQSLSLVAPPCFNGFWKTTAWLGSQPHQDLRPHHDEDDDDMRRLRRSTNVCASGKWLHTAWRSRPPFCVGVKLVQRSPYSVILQSHTQSPRSSAPRIPVGCWPS